MKFDGVLHRYTSGWKGAAEIPDGPVPGAMRWLLDMARNFTVTIYSARARTPDGLWAMKEAIRQWCRWLEIPNQDAEWMLGRLRWAEEKSGAWLTVDDRSWQFDGKFPTISQVDEFKTWTQLEQAKRECKVLPSKVRGETRKRGR